MIVITSPRQTQPLQDFAVYLNIAKHILISKKLLYIYVCVQLYTHTYIKKVLSSAEGKGEKSATVLFTMNEEYLVFTICNGRFKDYKSWRD